MDSYEIAKGLMIKGYRRTSNKHRLVSRIDRPDWVQVLAVHLNRSPAELYVPGAAEPAAHWCDYYRRVLSEDTMVVDPLVSARIPTSTGDPIGFKEAV